jgi:hypothetical protein
MGAKAQGQNGRGGGGEKGRLKSGATQFREAEMGGFNSV